MASKAQEILKRRDTTQREIAWREKEIQHLPTCDVLRNKATYASARLFENGTIGLGNLTITREEAIELASWLLDMFTGHVEPPTEKEEEKP